MATPSISSGLSQAQSPGGGPTRTNAPKGRLMMIVGPAGRGPTQPQIIEDPSDAYRIYGTEGPLADDIALALRGAEIGSSDNTVGQVLALRTETGTPADLTLKNAGTDVITFKTATSGTRANQWTVQPKDGQIVIYDPESEQDITFNYDPTGTASDIRTPSELAEAINDATSGRLQAEVHRSHAHFELSLSDQTTAGSVDVDSSDAETAIDFSDASVSDVEGLAVGGNTAIGNDTGYFDTGDDPVFNYLIPEEAGDERFYAITAGQVTELPAGNQQIRLDHLADAKRIAVGTESLLNVRTDGGEGTEVALTETGQRGGSTVSEGYFRIRKDYAGRLDTTDTEGASAEFADYTAEIATDEDISGYLGSENASASLSIDSTSLSAGDHVLVYGQGTDTDGLYKVGDDGGDLYLETQRHRTASTLSQTGATVEVASGSHSGIQRYSAGSGEVTEAEVVSFSFAAPQGIADNDGAGAAGPLATSYADHIGESSAADDLSVNRLAPEGEMKFDEYQGAPVKVMLAPATNPNDAREYEGDMKVQWSEGEATILLDRAELVRDYSDALVFLSFDTCIFDLKEAASRNELGGVSTLDYTVDGQTLVFSDELEHDLVVRPLRVTQYERGYDLEVRRTANDGNKIVFSGRDNQPGAAGKALTDIETIFGFEYDYEPSFPPAGTTKSLSGATSGVNASAQKKAQALEQALREYGNRDHDTIIASGLYVDEMTDGKDPVTGEKINEPVGVLTILQRHIERMDQNGASPVVYAAVRPMQESTTTGAFTDAQKRKRVRELTQPAGPGEANAASIIQSESREQVFIFDAPYRASVGGRTIETASPALFAGMRSTMPITSMLYRQDVGAIAEPVYKYDTVVTGGSAMKDQLSRARINTWDPKRGRVRLADETTAAGYTQSENGELVPNGWQSGLALLAAKKFQQDAVDQLEPLLGSVPEGGIDVLRGSTETILFGVANRTSGVNTSRFKRGFNAQRDINIKANEGNSLGMYINVVLPVRGELKEIDLQVGAITATGESSSGGGSVLPTAQ